MFTVGLDIPLLFKCNRDEMTQLWRELYGLMKALASSSIPICAAITGHAPAGGTVIALFCDWRVAAQGDFKLGLSEVQVGIPLPPVILSALGRQVGARKAEHLAAAGLILIAGTVTECWTGGRTGPWGQEFSSIAISRRGPGNTPCVAGLTKVIHCFRMIFTPSSVVCFN